jgi:undecaprenyl-diphosphatase
MATQGQASRPDERLVHRGGAYAGAAAAAVLLGALTWLVVYQRARLTEVDRAIEAPIHRWALETPWAVQVSDVLAVVGGLGVSTAATVVVVLVLLLAKRPWIALNVALIASLAPFLTDRLKEVIERPRPEWAVPVAQPPANDPFSFPSGHATGGIAVWLTIGVALAALLRSESAKAWLVLPFAVLGISIGLSRIVLGLHWPSDVLAGFALATAVAALASALFVMPKKDRPRPVNPSLPPPVPYSSMTSKKTDPDLPDGAEGALPEAVAEAAPEGAPAPGRDAGKHARS